MRRILGTITLVTFVCAVGADAQPQSRSQTQSFDSNGVRIAYIDQGQGQPVVLLHGLNGNKEGWQPAVVPRLTAAGFRVVAHDARASGDSGYPTGPERFGQEDVNDVIRLLDHLSIDRAHRGVFARRMDCESRGPPAVVTVRRAVFGGWGLTIRLKPCRVPLPALPKPLSKESRPLLLRALTPIGCPSDFRRPIRFLRRN